MPSNSANAALTLPWKQRTWPFECSTPTYNEPYIYRPRWGCDKPRPLPRVVVRGKMRLRDIPGSRSARYGIDGPDDARILCTPGGKKVYFWVSRGAHTKGQIGIGQNAPWEGSKKDKRYVDSVEAAIALAKILGWLSDSGPLPETMK